MWHFTRSLDGNYDVTSHVVVVLQSPQLDRHNRSAMVTVNDIAAASTHQKLEHPEHLFA